MGRQLSQKQIRAISNVITDMGYVVSLKQVKTNSLQQCLSGRGAVLKALRLPLLLDNRVELLPFQSRTADEKKNIPFPSICAGEQKSLRVFFLEAQSVLPETVIESQGSCFLFSRAAQGSGSAERKSIHQRVITGLISLLL